MLGATQAPVVPARTKSSRARGITEVWKGHDETGRRRFKGDPSVHFSMKLRNEGIGQARRARRAARQLLRCSSGWSSSPKRNLIPLYPSAYVCVRTDDSELSTRCVRISNIDLEHNHDVVPLPSRQTDGAAVSRNNFPERTVTAPGFYARTVDPAGLDSGVTMWRGTRASPRGNFLRSSIAAAALWR